MRKLLNYLCFALYILCIQAGIAQAVSSAVEYPPVGIMLGEMILVGFAGTSLADDAPVLQALRDHKAGGVILFDREAQTKKTRNIRTPKQTKALIATLQKATPFPIFIALDQEGGAVQRLSKRTGFQDWPSAKALGGLSVADIYSSAFEMGTVMAELGFNVNFAPVVDLHDPQSAAIGKLKRAFSEDPDKLIVAATAFTKGMSAAKLISVLKHFPGHGLALLDTHDGSADASKTWTAKELLPYKAFINEGFKGMIMTAHINIHQLDTMPATLSSRIINGLLRKELGFNGVVISDDIQMKAVSQKYTLEDTVFLAVNAGVDILLIGNNLIHNAHAARDIHTILLNLVEEGRISEERIKASWHRIMTLKRLLPEID